MVGRGNGIVGRGIAERLVDDQFVIESNGEEEFRQIHLESA